MAALGFVHAINLTLQKLSTGEKLCVSFAIVLITASPFPASPFPLAVSIACRATSGRDAQAAD